MKRLVRVCGLALLLCGCAQTPRWLNAPVAHPAPKLNRAATNQWGDRAVITQQADTQDMEVWSDPAGARIECGNAYLGEAPLIIRVPSTADRRFRESMTVRALPVVAGHFVQTKFFKGTYGAYIPGEKIPKRILFQMGLGPAPIEIRQREASPLPRQSADEFLKDYKPKKAPPAPRQPDLT